MYQKAIRIPRFAVGAGPLRPTGEGARRRGGGGSAAVAGALSAGAFVAGRHLLWGLSDAGKRRRVGERVFGPVSAQPPNGPGSWSNRRPTSVAPKRQLFSPLTAC